MNKPTLSAGRTNTPFDPTKVLWTVMYYDNGLRPYCEEYTALTYRQSRELLIKLKAQFPRSRFTMTPHTEDHLTRNQAVKAVCNLFRQADRPDLCKAAANADMSTAVKVLAPLAFKLQRDMAAEAAFERMAERRKELGLRPVPKPAGRPEPLLSTDNRGRLTIHMGGAR